MSQLTVSFVSEWLAEIASFIIHSSSSYLFAHPAHSYHLAGIFLYETRLTMRL